MEITNFKPIRFVNQNVGIGVKRTRKHFVWVVEIDGKELVVELFCYLISSTRVVNVNSNLIFSGKKTMFQDFYYSFNLDKHMFTIQNSKTLTDLIIDSVSFEKLYNMKIGYRMYPQGEEIKAHHFEPGQNKDFDERDKEKNLEELFENKEKNLKNPDKIERKTELLLESHLAHSEDLFLAPAIEDHFPEKTIENHDKIGRAHV